VINPIEGVHGDYMAVVIRPSSKNRIEQPDQVRLFSRLVGLDDFTDFVKMCIDVRFRRFHQELAVVLANVPSEEIKPILDVRYPGLFW
jgi:hypothetical protein